MTVITTMISEVADTPTSQAIAAWSAGGAAWRTEETPQEATAFPNHRCSDCDYEEADEDVSGNYNDGFSSEEVNPCCSICARIDELSQCSVGRETGCRACYSRRGSKCPYELCIEDYDELTVTKKKDR